MIGVNDCAVIRRGIRELAGLAVVYSASPCEMKLLNLLLNLPPVPLTWILAARTRRK